MNRNELEAHIIRNNINIKDIAIIPLTQEHYAIVDKEDEERIRKHPYHAVVCKRTTYAKRTHYNRNTKKAEAHRMHRDILKTPKGLDTDHINHQGCDNRKINLRAVTRQQNNWNTMSLKQSSGYQGVSSHNKGYQALISLNNKKIYLGTFSTPQEASVVYQEARKQYYGEFA